MDKWILSKLQKVIKNCTEYFECYEYSKAKQEVEQFFWNVYCDNYLEIVKDRLYNPGNYHKGARESAQYALYEATLNLLKLIAPIMPYITEEIYQMHFAVKEGEKSIHISGWPEYNPDLSDNNAELSGDYLVGILAAVRKFKSEKSLSLKQEISLLVIDAAKDKRSAIELVLPDLKATTMAKDIEFGNGNIKIGEGLRISITL